MELDTAFAFAAPRSRGVLITLRRDGRPQASNINYTANLEGRQVQISVTNTRAKTRNLRRDERASLHVTSDDFWAWVVVAGTASFSPVASADNPESLRLLRDLYREALGDHPDWDDYDRAMIEDGRMVLTIDVDHAYGQIPE